jgi:hypothetical protein
MIKEVPGRCCVSACGGSLTHVGHQAGIRLVTLSYESKAPDSQNVSEDKNGTIRVLRRSRGRAASRGSR